MAESASSFRFGRIFKLSLGFLGLLPLTACQMGYLAKSSYYQLKLLSQRESFDKAMKDPKIDGETKRKIKLVQEVKAFAENDLSLVHSANYETFVLLDDKYVVYAISASYKDRLEPFTWTFPIVGKVPYKGYFKKRDADSEKLELEKQDLDVAQRGVSAYSTLGWFSDPLLSSMMNYEDEDLVDTIIHETTHATVYVKGNAEFNERLATFVGNKGMEAFYTAKQGADSTALRRARLMAQDSNIFSKFISKELKTIEDFYSRNKTSSTLLKDREMIFDRVKTNFEQSCKPLLKTETYKYFSDLKINNAVLLNYKTYYQNLDSFEKAFEKMDRQWPRFIGFFQGLKNSKRPEEELQKLIALP